MKNNIRRAVFPAPLAILNINKKYDYPIYKKVDEKKFQILVEKDNIYDKKKCAFIKKEDSQKVFIDIKDKLKYQNDIQEHLSNIIDDKTVCMNVKANLINDIAKEAVNKLFENEVILKNLEEVDNILTSSIDFILSDDLAMHSMLNVASYDYYTSTHCIDVSTYAIGFASFLNLPKDDIKLIAKSALLHDLGKKDIDRDIVCKKGRLTKDEFNIMKGHPANSRKILEKQGEKNTRLLNIIEQHHEKCDGSGYPKGLKNDEIDEFAKIVSICDVFNALTTKRSYKEKMTTFEAFVLMYNKMQDELCLNYLSKFINFMKVS